MNSCVLTKKDLDKYRRDVLIAQELIDTINDRILLAATEKVRSIKQLASLAKLPEWIVKSAMDNVI